MVGEFLELVFRDAVLSADGRTDVDSEVTADQHGRLDAGERLQRCWHAVRPLRDRVIRPTGGHDRRVMPEHSQGLGLSALLPGGQPEHPSHFYT